MPSGVLVADEPVDGLGGGGPQVAGVTPRAALRRRHHAERHGDGAEQRQAGQRDAGHARRSSGHCQVASRAAAACTVVVARWPRARRMAVRHGGGGGPNHAVSGRRLSDQGDGPTARDGAPVAIDAPRRGAPGGPCSTRNRASQSSAPTAAANRRGPGRSGSTTSTRSRVDGTAQITSAAIARYENTSTEAVSWIDDVEAHSDPHGRVAGAAPPQAEGDEQLGEPRSPWRRPCGTTGR